MARPLLVLALLAVACGNPPAKPAATAKPADPTAPRVDTAAGESVIRNILVPKFCRAIKGRHFGVESKPGGGMDGFLKFTNCDANAEGESGVRLTMEGTGPVWIDQPFEESGVSGRVQQRMPVRVKLDYRGQLELHKPQGSWQSFYLRTRGSQAQVEPLANVDAQFNGIFGAVGPLLVSTFQETFQKKFMDMAKVRVEEVLSRGLTISYNAETEQVDAAFAETLPIRPRQTTRWLINERHGFHQKSLQMSGPYPSNQAVKLDITDPRVRWKAVCGGAPFTRDDLSPAKGASEFDMGPCGANDWLLVTTSDEDVSAEVFMETTNAKAGKELPMLLVDLRIDGYEVPARDGAGACWEPGVVSCWDPKLTFNFAGGAQVVSWQSQGTSLPASNAHPTLQVVLPTGSDSLTISVTATRTKLMVASQVPVGTATLKRDDILSKQDFSIALEPLGALRVHLDVRK